MQHQSMWLSQVDPDLQTKHHHLPWAEFGDHSPGKTTPVLQVSKPQSELENLFNTFINKIRTAQKYRLGWSKELSFSQAALMSLRAVTVSRTYFLYLSFSHTSVLWRLSWPTLLIRRSSGIFTRPCLVGCRCLSHVWVMAITAITALLQLQELAASGSLMKKHPYRAPAPPWRCSLAEGRVRQSAECCWPSNGEANSCANQLGVRVHWEHQGSMQGCWASTGGVPVVAEKGEFCFKALQVGYGQFPGSRG